ncbi:putative ribonuclease H-like domain-containing protein [Tanacetum coccineum]
MLNDIFGLSRCDSTMPITDHYTVGFHDATNAKTLWTAIKARFGGNDASKKMQKNLLKQQFETFTIGSREELDSAYERFQNILSMLELYDAKVSLEDANLKFLRSLPSVWHVVATMIRGQPGLDELEFDDLYNNLKVYEHELKGVSNSNSQNIAFLSTEAIGSTLKQRPRNLMQNHRTYAYDSLTEVEQDDWSMEFNAEHVHFRQDGLGDFDWSNKADDTPVSLALMATNSEVPYCSKCSKSYKKLLESYQTERDNFQKARTEILGYQMSLESLEVILKTHEKNEYAWGDKYEQMEYDLKIRDLKLEEKQKELDQALKERDDFKEKLEKWSNAAVLQNEVLNKQRYVSDKSCIGFGVESSSSMDSENTSRNTNSSESSYPNFQKATGFHSVPPPTGTIIPPRANVSFTGIDELAIRNKVLNQENTKSSQPEIDRNKVIIEDWVDSDDEETVLNSSEIQKKTVLNSENSETSFENRSPSSQNSVGQASRKTGFGHKGGKLCFVCYSPNHLIKDCNLHERTFKQTQTHKPKGTQGTRDKRPVWNNIQRVNHSNFSRNSRYPHQRRSFIPSAVLTREGLKSTARPSKTQTVPSKSTANVFYQGTARPKVPHAVLSQSTGRPYYPRMDNTRPEPPRFKDSSQKPQRHKKIVNLVWVKKEVLFNPEEDIKDYAIIDSGCSESMTGGGIILRKRNHQDILHKNFEKVSYVKELKFNLLSVSQICDKKHNVLFTDKECLILSLKFKFVDEDLVILRAPGKRDVYRRWILKNKLFPPSGGITCLDQRQQRISCLMAHMRRLGQANFKNINKLVKGNLVRGLPSKTFKLDHSCLACRKGKQHRASCKKIEERTVREPLELLHMDLFGPVSVESVNRKKYCLVVTDDCSKFSWVFFLAYKDETYDMLHDLIVGLENKLRHKVKTIRCDHGTEFKNQLMNEFCAKKGIQRENNYSIAKDSTAKWSRRKERKESLSESCEILYQFWVIDASQKKAYLLDTLLTQRNAFEKEKKRIALEKGKECVDSTFTLSTANTPPQSTGNTPTDSDDDIPKDGVFSTNSFDAENTDTEEGGAADYNNMDPTIDVTSTPTLRIHKIHPQSQIIGKSTAGVQTRRKLKDSTSNQHQALLSFIYKQNRTNHKDQQTCLFACFLSQEEPKKVSQALADESWIEAMQEELLQFKLQESGARIFKSLRKGFSPAMLSKDLSISTSTKIKSMTSTSGGCQNLGRRLVTWMECKKQTIMAISSTEAEYVAAASCLQNESNHLHVMNPVFHSKTKHIQNTTHHFNRDVMKKGSINVVKVHTDDNVADLLTKGFDLARFNFLVIASQMTLAAEEEHSTSPHSRAASSARDAQGTPTQSAAQASLSQGTAEVQGTDNSHGTANLQGTAASQDASQTSGGDEGLLDLYALNREVKRLKRQTLSQAKQIIKLKTKLKKLSKFVQPVVKHHAFWVESQNLKKRRKKQRKKHKKKVSSVKLGRNKEEGTLSEEHYVQDDTADPFFEDIVDKDAAVTPDIERKSDETEALERKSTARQSTITPRTLNFDDEAGPSSPIRPTQNIEPEEQFKVDEVLADISRPRGLSIPGPIQSQPQPQQPSQATDPKDKGKGILVEEPKKKKLTLQQIRALETTNDEEVARKIQAEWDAEEERKRLEELKKQSKPKTTVSCYKTEIREIIS